MTRIRLREIRLLDNGTNTHDSFAIVSHHHSKQDVVRLIGDLLLATREKQGTDDAVSFDQVENLVNQAAGYAVARIAEISEALGVYIGDEGLEWAVWNSDHPGMRHPTAKEVIEFEGESRIMWDSLPRGNENAQLGSRLLAAWGCFCVERAMGALKLSRPEEAISLYASAGLLLSHANYFIGCVTVDKLARSARLHASSKGGSTAAMHWRLVAEEAVRLATASGLASGNHSADYVAGKIENQVRQFARSHGRDFPGDSAARKIASYLRDAGISKKRRTP